MTSSFNTAHPRGGNPANTGQFSEKPATDPGVVLAIPAGPLTDADKAALARFAGWSGLGFDSYDLARLRDAMPHGYQLRYNGMLSMLEGRTDDDRWRPLSDEFHNFLVRGREGDPVPDQLLRVEPQPQFDLSEKDWLNENAGVFALGYDETMIDGMASSLPSIKVACVWDRYDQYGFGGDSQMYGRIGDGPWRPFSSEANSYLADGQPGDDFPAVFLDEPDGLELNLDTVRVMNAHNYVVNQEG